MHAHEAWRDKLRFSVTMWDPQHINIAEPLTIAEIKLLTLSPTSFFTFSHSEFLSIFPPSLTHHPPIHLRWLHYPPHCNSQKMERELESRQQEEQSCWFWLATFKYDKIKTFPPSGEQMFPNKQTEVVVCTNHVCLAASPVNAGSSGLLAAGVQFSYHFVVSDKDVERTNICTVKRLSQPKKGILWWHSSLLSPWQMRAAGDTGVCSHSRTQRTEPEACWVWALPQWLSPTAPPLYGYRNLYCLVCICRQLSFSV